MPISIYVHAVHHTVTASRRPSVLTIRLVRLGTVVKEFQPLRSFLTPRQLMRKQTDALVVKGHIISPEFSTQSVLSSSEYLQRHPYTQAPALHLRFMGGPRVSGWATLIVIPIQFSDMLR
jgi:hypothetical protein